MTDDRMEERLLGTEAKDISSLPGKVWAESKKAWRVTFPAMLARVTNFGVFVVTQAFIGHISKTELAAYALIQIIGVRFANGILVRISLPVFPKLMSTDLVFRTVLVDWLHNMLCC